MENPPIKQFPMGPNSQLSTKNTLAMRLDSQLKYSKHSQRITFQKNILSRKIAKIPNTIHEMNHPINSTIVKHEENQSTRLHNHTCTHLIRNLRNPNTRFI